MPTIYHCCVERKDTCKSLQVVYEADTEKEAIEYLENNEGGVYENILHRFKMSVKGKNKYANNKNSNIR